MLKKKDYINNKNLKKNIQKNIERDINFYLISRLIYCTSCGKVNNRSGKKCCSQYKSSYIFPSDIKEAEVIYNKGQKNPKVVFLLNKNKGNKKIVFKKTYK